MSDANPVPVDAGGEALSLAFDAGWTAGRGAGDDATYSTKRQLRDEYLAHTAPVAGSSDNG